VPRGVARIIAAVVALIAAASLSGCGLRMPVDPGGTLDRIDESGMLRAGASPSEGLVDVSGAEVDGPLAELVEAFARERNARVTWVVGSEEQLVDALEAGELDLAVGGMTDATPWALRASVTRGYPGVPGSEGRPVVVLLPLGENALQVALETFLDQEVGE
jgi:ABC-type amino acid transport substrate-binding protein